MNKVVVGLSGGVDSSVAALLLKRAGFEVTGVYLKCYWTDEGCPSDQDRASAAKVASFLEIPFEVWDFEKEYRASVVEYFYSEYQKGRTPNPDVVCNREIKFGLFAQKALKLPSTLYMATGHYARIAWQNQRSKIKDQNGEGGWLIPKFYQEDITHDTGGIRFVDVSKYVRAVQEFKNLKVQDAGDCGKFGLFGGEDDKKDQSYFLYDIEPDIIEHILFPLGNLTKSQVRSIAKEAGLPTAERPDSAGICFVGEVKLEKFLKERIREHQGEVVDKKGNVVGRHEGVEFYTIGQRHGFAINSKLQFKTQNLGPLYVIAKDVGKNRLMVGVGEECKTQKFLVEISENSELITHNSELFVRIRHLGEMIPCEVEVVNPRVSVSTAAVSDGKGTVGALSLAAAADYRGNTSSTDFELRVKLSYPVFGVAPGQSAVFYRKIPVVSHRSSVVSRRSSVTDLWLVVGGGIIE